MKMPRFLIHLIIAQLFALGIAYITKDKFAPTFYIVCVCLLIWDAFLGIVYFAVPEQKHGSLAFSFLFSVASAWIVPLILSVTLIFIPQETLRSLLHFGMVK
jgi:hypothetical protein